MIGLQHIPLLATFFDGVDAALSNRFMRPVPPQEPALTSELCALLDAATQRRERSLKFNVDRLNSSLAALGDDLQFDFRIDTHQHSAKMENLVSQSDLGLVIEYQNFILPEESCFWSYFLQAKRLFPSDTLGQYGEKAAFTNGDHRQHDQLNLLAKKFGDRFFRYILYCPATSYLSREAATKIRALHTRNLASPIYDYLGGLSLADYVKRRSGKIDSGIWLTPIETPPSGVIDLHAEAFKTASPFTWFFLQHLTKPDIMRRQSRGREPGRHLHDKMLGRIDENIDGIEDGLDQLIRKVVSGDRASIEHFCSHAFGGETRDVPKFRILPKNTITVSVSVGSSLPSDFRRAFRQG